uniref:protein NRT1/ PTR FAMILY 5.5-like n=1 Tax=Erigeron canadensis TaxID=72917 RepID=UPI001CB9A334|nr:protein NRT1/ PTR FAMILY 5.5-like [Erigeron canadensis]
MCAGVLMKAGPLTFIRVTALMFIKIPASYTLFVIIIYLNNVWNLSVTHAAGIINIWNGITPTLTVVFACFADTFTGSYYYMLMLSNIAYSIGLGLLALSTPVFFGSCNEYKEDCIGHTQKVLFFTALSLISVGLAGHEASLPLFVDAQKRSDDNDNETAGFKYFHGVKFMFLYMQTISLAVLVGLVALIYVKPWSKQFGIPAICSLAVTGFFLIGSYKRNKPGGNPFKTALRVFVATASKYLQQVQSKNFTETYNEDDTSPTSSLRFLDKAATKYPDQAMSRSWTLCTVREVEDTKIAISLVPVCLTFIVIGIVSSLKATYFIQQANHMDLKLGSIEVRIPIFLLFYTIFGDIFRMIYTFCFALCFSKRYAPPIGIGVGIILSVLCCITAAIVETQRLHAVKDHGLLDKPNDKIPMSVFSLLPQFALLAGADAITDFSFTFFVQYQLPEFLRYMIYFKDSVMGLGTIASVLLVYVVGKVSERNNNPNWFQHSLNKSRLDRYYWTLAAISAVNLVLYVVVACFNNHESPLPEAEPEAGAGDEPEAGVGDEPEAGAGVAPEAEAKPQAEVVAGIQIDDDMMGQQKKG